jgi:hypothetical protein
MKWRNARDPRTAAHLLLLFSNCLPLRERRSSFSALGPLNSNARLECAVGRANANGASPEHTTYPVLAIRLRACTGARCARTQRDTVMYVQHTGGVLLLVCVHSSKLSAQTSDHPLEDQPRLALQTVPLINSTPTCLYRVISWQLHSKNCQLQTPQSGVHLSRMSLAQSPSTCLCVSLSW